MGEQRNLTEDNVDELKNVLDKMKESNADLEYRFFVQEKANVSSEKHAIMELNAKVDALTRKIDLIFDDHVLVRGKFVNTEIITEQELKKDEQEIKDPPTCTCTFDKLYPSLTCPVHGVIR